MAPIAPIALLVLVVVFAILLHRTKPKCPSKTNYGRATQASLDFETSIKVRRLKKFPRLNA